MLQTMSRRIRLLDDKLADLMQSEAASLQQIAKLRAESEYSGRGGDR
jgi:hypothetical protein